MYGDIVRFGDCRPVPVAEGEAVLAACPVLLAADGDAESDVSVEGAPDSEAQTALAEGDKIWGE
jgi:hypothetical protein